MTSNMKIRAGAKFITWLSNYDFKSITAVHLEGIQEILLLLQLFTARVTSKYSSTTILRRKCVDSVLSCTVYAYKTFI